MARVREEPTLSDIYLTHPRILDFGPSTERMLSAHKFVLDARASEFVGNLLLRAPLEVLQEHEFARPPYDVTWVEFDHRAYFRGLDLQSTYKPEETDDKVGFLFDHGKVWQVFNGVTDPSPGIMPYLFHLHQPVSFEQELELAQKVGLSRLVLRSALLGAVNTSDKWWQSPEATDICRSHRIELLEKGVIKDLPTDRWRSLMLDGAGSLKLILTLCLLLTRPGFHVLSQSEIGHRKVIYKGKNVVYKAHHRISLRLEHKDPVTYFTRHLSTGLHRRRHGVKGHWAQTRKLKSRGCDHQWDGLSPDHYECTMCGAKRWWRKAHMRGDATIGVVTKDYDVTR